MTPNDITKAIKDKSVGFLEVQYMDSADQRISQEVMRYDAVSNDMECKWGFGRLLQLAPPELQDKWHVQITKLNDAIESRDINAVTQLVNGCVRGWSALEASAEALGHVSYPPYCWECEVDGEVYKVARTREDAKAVSKWESTQGEVLTLEELCRVYANRKSKVSDTSLVTEEPKQTINFPSGGDDELPF